MPNFPLKAANSLKYLNKNIFDTFSQHAQLRLLPEFPKGSNCFSLSELINSSGLCLRQNNQP